MRISCGRHDMEFAGHCQRGSRSTAKARRREEKNFTWANRENRVKPIHSLLPPLSPVQLISAPFRFCIDANLNPRHPRDPRFPFLREPFALLRDFAVLSADAKIGRAHV